MSTVPKMAAKFADPDGSGLRSRGEELLDMVRQHKYAEVMRRANLRRHLEQCRKCRPDRTCTEARELAGRVAASMNALGDLRDDLERLDRDQADADRQRQAPVAVSGNLTMF